MKKIYTLLKSTALFTFLLGFSTSSFSQSICGPTTEDFNNTSGSTAGFTGDFAIGTAGVNGFLQKSKVIANGIYTITSPTYQLAASSTYLGFGFILSGTEKVASVRVAIMYISTLHGELCCAFLTPPMQVLVNSLVRSIFSYQ